ncbi:hypothetical protein D3C71_1121270 [compost metagenome]
MENEAAIVEVPLAARLVAAVITPLTAPMVAAAWLDEVQLVTGSMTLVPSR